MIRVGQKARGLRMMGAGIDRIDPGAFRSEQSDNSILHGFKFRP